MVLGLWSSTAGVGAGRGSGLPGRGVPGLLPRLWGVVLAVAVTLTLFAVVDVAAGPAAQASPPPVVATVPPKVTDANKVRQLGFPSGADGTEPGTDGGFFKGVEVRDGWVVANINPYDFENMRLLPRDRWELFTDEQWQKRVNDISGILDQIQSVESGELAVRSAGELNPYPGDHNQWVDWSAGTAGGVSHIQTVVFPNGSKNAAQALNSELAGNGTGSAGSLYLDYEHYAGEFEPLSGELRARDAVVTTFHETVHRAHQQAGARAPHDGKTKVVRPIFPGAAGEAPAPKKPLKRIKAEIKDEEVLTHGGEKGMSSFVKKQIAKLQEQKIGATPEKTASIDRLIKNLSTKSNPHLNVAARTALKRSADPNEPTSWNDVRRLDIRSELASRNPTEIKFSKESGRTTRSEYVTGSYAEGPNGKREALRKYTTAEGVSTSDLTKEDFENPERSAKLRRTTPAFPTCSEAEGGHDTCLPDETNAVDLTEEESQKLEDEVKARSEWEKSSTSESVFFESLSVEDLQVLAGSSVTGSAEMVRG
ncbi:hypothetical protein ACFUOZ_21315, partial [Paenarthrobacter sp. NPDC057355]|uniref:hypothetical protein n=1 Tax=Paenarthrobacter sp. NPDC057355 TaxID=3346105 RepID=UPI003643ECAE